MAEKPQEYKVRVYTAFRRGSETLEKQISKKIGERIVFKEPKVDKYIKGVPSIFNSNYKKYPLVEMLHPEKIIEWLYKKSNFLVLLEDGEKTVGVGSVILGDGPEYMEGKIAEFARTAVLPAYQGNGFGKKLSAVRKAIIEELIALDVDEFSELWTYSEPRAANGLTQKNVLKRLNLKPFGILPKYIVKNDREFVIESWGEVSVRAYVPEELKETPLIKGLIESGAACIKKGHKKDIKEIEEIINLGNYFGRHDGKSTPIANTHITDFGYADININLTEYNLKTKDLIKILAESEEVFKEYMNVKKVDSLLEIINIVTTFENIGNIMENIKWLDKHYILSSYIPGKRRFALQFGRILGKKDNLKEVVILEDYGNMASTLTNIVEKYKE